MGRAAEEQMVVVPGARSVAASVQLLRAKGSECLLLGRGTQHLNLWFCSLL